MAETGLGALLVHARSRLREAGIADAANDARLIVEGLTGTSRTDALVHSDMAIGGETSSRIDAALGRRIAGEPVHRILGSRGFYGLELALSAGTLEPRPDTEILVDAAIGIATACVARKGHCRILDLGTGSGAIALATLANVAGSTALGVDISDDALATARRNADMNGCDSRFLTMRSNWFDAVSGKFDLIVSNPPYIATSEIDELEAGVRRFDPHPALDGGPDGLCCYRAIAGEAAVYLDDEGRIAVEIGHDQRADVCHIFETKGFTTLETRRDLGGGDRIAVFV